MDRAINMEFCGKETDRKVFLHKIRTEVMNLTGERMTLAALIHEIAKNIFDHAGGVGSLIIEFKDGAFEFEIKDGGEEAYDFDECSRHSRLAGNGVNCGIGLRVIRDLAKDLGVELSINTSKGFSYSGIYTPRKHVN